MADRCPKEAHGHPREYQTHDITVFGSLRYQSLCAWCGHAWEGEYVSESAKRAAEQGPHP